MRLRIRSFPSLVNCCTIDWFSEWPEDALAACATKFLSEIRLEAEVKSNCCNLCSIYHGETLQYAEKFKHALKRY